MLKYFITILIFLSPCASFAQSQQVEEVENFSAHMIDHDFKGCPENSHCSQEMGKVRLKWVELLQDLTTQPDEQNKTVQLIQQFYQENGVPLALWGFAPGLKNPEIISWNSHCPNHNTAMNEVFHALKFIKSFNDLEEVDLNSPEADKSLQLIPQMAWLQTQDKKSLIEFRIPRGSLPTQMIQNKLYFTQEDKGVYYALLVDRDGEFEVNEIQKPAVEPKKVPCPKELKEKYEDWPLTKRLYQEPFCRAIWDKDRKTYQVLLFGWSCP